MTRIAIVTLGLAITAITTGAMVPASQVTGVATVHETVITKNQVWPKLGPMVFQDCFTETCEGK